MITRSYAFHWLFTLVVLGSLFSLERRASADDPLVYYQIEGALEEGGEFFGTFAIDTLATDKESTLGYGEFDLVDVEIHLVNTTLFGSGGNTATSGIATEATFVQSDFGPRQLITFTLLASNGLSNAFTELVFMPFTGDPDTISPIEGPFVDGYFDGSGQSSIVSLSLVRVPEPASVLLALMGLMAMPRRRSA